MKTGMDSQQGLVLQLGVSEMERKSSYYKKQVTEYNIRRTLHFAETLFRFPTKKEILNRMK